MDSVTTPTSYSSAKTPPAAGASYTASFGSFSHLYGRASTSHQPSQNSQWSNSNASLASGQQYNPYAGTSSYQTSHIPPGPGTAPGYRGSMPKGRGGRVRGTYRPPSNTLNYERVDQSYYVRSKEFFFEGRVFSVIMNETAGSNSTSSNGEDATDYNSSNSINTVKYENNFVYTNVRRFIVVRQKREFCYACPIFTYSGRATTKRGVRPEEHGIAYSWGKKPQLIPGEGGITKPSIAVVMAEGLPSLHVASRIYYGIIHPIQYNVKVKEIGYIPTAQIPWLISNWKAEEDGESNQDPTVAHNADILEEDDEDEEAEANNDLQGGAHDNEYSTRTGGPETSNVNAEAINELSDTLSRSKLLG
jgi:hypothetical protein